MLSKPDILKFLLLIILNAFLYLTVRDLPPICLDVRQKQRVSIDALPPEMKAPVLPESVLPNQPKTMKDFQ